MKQVTATFGCLTIEVVDTDNDEWRAMNPGWTATHSAFITDGDRRARVLIEEGFSTTPVEEIAKIMYARYIEIGAERFWEQYTAPRH